MLDVNWNALYGFWVVAEHRSFSAAARALPRGTVQALYKRVRQLEEPQNLNLKLFRSRGVKGVELTEAGSRLYRLLDPPFRSVARLISELQDEDRGPLVVAMTGYCAYNYGPRIIPGFQKRFPNVSLTIRVLPAANIIALLEKGHADIGLCSPPTIAKHLTTGVSAHLPIEIIATRGHALASGPITWKDVVREPLVIPARNSRFRLEFERLMYRKNLSSQLRVVTEVNEGELAVAAVRSGVGVAIIGVGPRLIPHLSGLARIAPPPGLPKQEVAILHRSDRYLPAYMRAFQQTVAAVIRPTK